MSIFEIVMLFCFGFAWPFSIYKSYKSRSNSGKSVAFLYIIFAGYLAGVAHKIVYNPDIVIILYCINGVMVFIDILIFYRNKNISGEIK